ncbi:hypothetical protein [Bacillus cereus]|uniref:Uncharacterized protein n=1 Tax=Bacillus cereus HuA3-9 TaxID=1053205 RepID=R8CB48_BACCE|nr:hypothetical protein [Bacillus cereus]EOO08760.1 hypothetical protein IGA_06334 [Bacillus cereus HuA3-9]
MNEILFCKNCVRYSFHMHGICNVCDSRYQDSINIMVVNQDDIAMLFMTLKLAMIKKREILIELDEDSQFQDNENMIQVLVKEYLMIRSLWIQITELLGWKMKNYLNDNLEDFLSDYTLKKIEKIRKDFKNRKEEYF